MKRCFLLDTSFVIDLLNEIAAGEPGSAMAWLKKNPRAQLWISPVTLAEVLEGAEDPDAVSTYLSRYQWQGIYRTHAVSAAGYQHRSDRRMGENDAWQAAVATQMDAKLLADDHTFQRLGARYERYR